MEEFYFEVIKFGHVISRNEDELFGKVISNIFVTYEGFLFQITRVDSELVDIISLGQVDT